MKKKIIFLLSVFLIIIFLYFLYPFFYTFIFKVEGNEIVVIGLDGGDYELIEQLIREGKLPNLEKIIENGTISTFRSTSKSLDSYSAWNSLTKCGNSSLWIKLKESNISYGTLNWPNVSEFGVFTIINENDNEKWPDEVYDSKALIIFLNPVTEFFRKLYWFKIIIPQDKIEKDLIYDFYLLDRNAREFYYLREKFKPNISFLVLSSPLRIERYFWMYMFPSKYESYVTNEEKEKYGKVIENYYIELDNFIGKLCERNKTLVIISNRGVKERYPPKIVDKIDINKILKEANLLEFDYRGEINFLNSKAFTFEEGLDENLIINIKKDANISDIKEKLKKLFEETKILLSNQKIANVSEYEDKIILRRNVPFILTDKTLLIGNKSFSLNDFLLRRIISVEEDDEGFIIINKKIKLSENMTSENFCDVLLTLLESNKK